MRLSDDQISKFYVYLISIKKIKENSKDEQI
jgi:hypothetical protein